ncbi:interleukin-5 [Sorex fumeus]|uniref:interleukin-5 n=1 Tax=Sorex fumeus TaxID=62283 RepID=UPI0024AE3257|nr:interleukin-5 [Sorex fumeus]
MKMILRLSLLALGAAYICALDKDNSDSHSMDVLVAETLTLLSTHQTLLIGNGSLWIPTPDRINHLLCIEDVFQEIDALKNKTVQGGTVEKLFQNLSSIKKRIDKKKENCGKIKRVKKFLDYLQEFLGVINSEWTMDN